MVAISRKIAVAFAFGLGAASFLSAGDLAAPHFGESFFHVVETLPPSAQIGINLYLSGAMSPRELQANLIGLDARAAEAGDLEQLRRIRNISEADELRAEDAGRLVLAMAAIGGVSGIRPETAVLAELIFRQADRVLKGHPTGDYRAIRERISPEVRDLIARNGWDKQAAEWDSGSAVMGGPSAGSVVNTVRLLPSHTEREAPAAAAEQRLYFFEKPLKLSTQLGPASKAMHYLSEAAIQATKVWLVYKGFGIHAAGFVALTHLSAYIPWVIYQSTADIILRSRVRTFLRLRGIEALAQAEDISVLTTSRLKYDGPIAARDSSQGFIFLRSAARITETEVPALGKLRTIEDPARTKLMLKILYRGKESSSYEVPLESILARVPLPSEMAGAFRKFYQENERKPKIDLSKWNSGLRKWLRPLLRLVLRGPVRRAANWVLAQLVHSDLRDLKLEAALIEPAEFGGPNKFNGALAQGKAVLKLLNVSKWRPLLGVDLPEKEGRIPLSKFSVVRYPKNRYVVPEFAHEILKNRRAAIIMAALTGLTIILGLVLFFIGAAPAS